MAKTKGVTYFDRWKDPTQAPLPSKQWYVRAWDGTNRRYLGKSFTDLQEGLAWGEETRSKFVLKLENAIPASLSELTKQYADELRERGRNDQYVAEIERVSKAIGLAGAEDLKSANVAKIVRDWLSNLKGNWYPDCANNKFRRKVQLTLSPITKNRFLQHLNSLMQYGVVIGSLLKNPLLGIRRFTQNRPLKATFTIDELKKLLHSSQEKDKYFLIFALLIYTGCRLQESLHLRWENIDFSGKRFSIKLSPEYDLKRGKERTVFLQPELSEILKPLKKNSGYIIPGEKWRANNRKCHSTNIKAYMERCGIEPGSRSPHSTRHTWVSILLATGENAFQVSAEAGHETLMTTQGYARNQGSYRDGVDGWKRGVFQFRAKVAKISFEDKTVPDTTLIPINGPASNSLLVKWEA